MWDRGNVHDQSKAVRTFLAEHPSIKTEQYPSDTPESNPDKGVWQCTKHGRQANFTREETSELRAAVMEELTRLQRSPKTSPSFIRRVKIPMSSC